MSDNNKPTLKIALHDEVMVTLLKDEPQSGVSSNGEWNRYDVKVEDKECLTLHLKTLTKH